MPLVTHKFRYAYGGHRVVTFHPGDEISEDDEAFATAREERWVQLPDGGQWPPVPRMWSGATVACVASGPSLTPEDVAHLQGRAKVIVVNDNWRLAPWAEILYAADEKWWNHHEGVPQFQGLKVTHSVPAAKRWNLKRLPGQIDAPGLSHDPQRLHQGGNSGYAAINLAWLLGARRIVLVGYDMQRRGEQVHWFGDHPKGLRNNGNFKKWAARFATIPPTLKGVEVINCSRETALECFPRARLEEVLP